ncbi:hypothetical protein [Anaerosporobacter sp.]|uniref:hypothetical protein n=1 Tax=Anaerosporobacter sp. TaxID=1872529 RepID=UPI00286EBE58|nr:hypothetical protein [Anaerosporobacter sp.]
MNIMLSRRFRILFVTILLGMTLISCSKTSKDKSEISEEKETMIETISEAVTVIADTREALKAYQEFLQSDKIYELTATEEYPRGDGSSYSDDSPEWKAYQQILSGNFDAIESLGEQSSLSWHYEKSLDEETGRSGWKYILMDFDNDGIKELFVCEYPEEADYLTAGYQHASKYTSVFSYKDGAVSWWYFEAREYRHIPLNDGRILEIYWYQNEFEMQIGRLEEDFYIIPEQGYEKLTVEYRDDFYGEPEWYDGAYFGEDSTRKCELRDVEYDYPEVLVPEGEYYFEYVYDEESDDIRLKELSVQEWATVKAEIEKLLIPNSEWHSASDFMPNREPKEFCDG